MSNLTMKDMLEAGSHFGHQTKRWNPKMKKYIFGARNGIYIIDLVKSLKLFNEACNFVSKLGSQGDKILFVGTKKQAQDVISEEAKRCEMYYINQRWLGGMLTNFATVSKSINRLKYLEEMENNGNLSNLPKKEVLKLNKEKNRLEKFFAGIKDMNALPSAIFIVDPRREKIAFHEAKKLNIKVIAIVDTNCDPEGIDYIIPGNDDAIRAIKLITSNISSAILDGRVLYNERKAAIEAEKQKELEAKQEAQKKAAQKQEKEVKAKKEAPKEEKKAAGKSKSKETKESVAKKESKAKVETKEKKTAAASGKKKQVAAKTKEKKAQATKVKAKSEA